MNIVILMGRLTKDPEIKDLNGKTKCNFTLAVDRPTDGVDFIDCIAWGKKAETIAKYFVKGQMLPLWGKLQNNIWTDSENRKRSNKEVVVDGFNFCEKKKEEEGDLPF